MLKSLMQWHKRLALICALPLIIWALSGLLHPTMSHFAKAPFIKPTKVSIEAKNIQSYLPLKSVLQNNHIESFSHASVVTVSGQHFYQVAALDENQQNVRYFDVTDGNESQTVTDLAYAAYLANIWSKQVVTGQPELITRFTAEYTDINRLLPVYKITLANGNFLYVDTLGKRIAAHNTPLRESLSYWFKQLHTFAFIAEKHSLLRIIPMVLISFIIFLVGVLGIASYGFMWSKTKGKKKNTQYFHRTTGLAISLSLIFFATSSTHILLDKFSPETYRAITPGNQITTATLNHDPLAATITAKANNFQLINLGNQIVTQTHVYRKKATEFAYWQNNKLDLDSTHVALAVIKKQLGVTGEIATWEQINSFGPTYGFINKRLPVVQFTLDNTPNIRYSVEPHTGYIALISDNWERARSWHFGYLHKYHFLNPLGKGPRDIIITIIILGICITIGLGLSIYMKRRARATNQLKQRNKLNLLDV